MMASSIMRLISPIMLLVIKAASGVELNLHMLLAKSVARTYLSLSDVQSPDRANLLAIDGSVVFATGTEYSANSPSILSPLLCILPYYPELFHIKARTLAFKF